MKPASESQKRKWLAAVKSVSKERQRKTIADAKDVGNLTYKEISGVLGLSEMRVKQIVGEVRAENQQKEDQPNA